MIGANRSVGNQILGGVGRLARGRRGELRTLGPLVTLIALVVAAPAAEATPLAGGLSFLFPATADLVPIDVMAADGTQAFVDPIDGAPILALAIVNGDLTLPLLEGNLDHTGFGLSLDVGDDRIVLADLDFDLTLEQVTASVTVEMLGDPIEDLGRIEIFGLRTCLENTLADACPDASGAEIFLNGFGLDFTSELAALANEFLPGVGVAEGDAFGTSIHQVELPEPSTALLLALAGLGGTRTWARRARRG